MTGTESTQPATETRCLRCRRVLRSAESIARRLGKGCAAKISAAAKAADLSAWTPSQIEDARQAIEDGAVVPSNREGVFHVVSKDGAEVHLVHSAGCNCENGLKTRQPRPCFHRCAVVIFLASQAAAVKPVAAPAPVAIPDSFWTEMDRLTSAFMAAA